MFVELEGGGKDTYARMLRDGLYSPYTWRVRHFREGEKHETLIRFRPDGRPYGFREQLAEAEPGPELTAAAARAIAERTARESWQIDLTPYALVEPSLARRPGGRVDHTFVYERDSPRLNDGRYRLRLVVSGDRLTEATHFILIPQASSRRYQEMRAANAALGAGSVAVMTLLYCVGAIAGLFYLARRRWVIARTPLLWGVAVAGLQLLVAINDWPLLWMTYDTAVPRTGFALQQIAILAVVFAGSSAAFGVSFMAAESLTRRAFGDHPQLWRVWSREAAASRPILGRTVAAYLLATVFLAYDVVLYFFAARLFGWWMPSEALIDPAILASPLPWLSAIANALQAGFWEESLLRAVPIAGAALIGDRFGRRRLFIVAAIACQALLFGAGHATSPMQPAYARAVELILPSIGFGSPLPRLRPHAGDPPPLRVRRHLVRHAVVRVHGERALARSGDRDGVDVRAFVDRAGGAAPAGTLGRSSRRRPQRRMGAAHGRRRDRRASGADERVSTASPPTAHKPSAQTRGGDPGLPAHRRISSPRVSSPASSAWPDGSPAHAFAPMLRPSPSRAWRRNALRASRWRLAGLRSTIRGA